MDALLRAEGIKKSFPGVQALDGVDLEVGSGEVVAVVGENGAGKSTLMKILCGAYRKDQGKVFLRERQVDFSNPLMAQRMGISIIYQELNLTRNQSVAANIFMVREPLVNGIGRWLRLVDKRRMENAARELLERIDAKVSATARVGDLPVAQRQMVEIAKALAVEANVIIMDEPTAALGGGEVERLFDIVRSLKSRGMAIIFITHRLDEVFRIADRIVVLRDGRLAGAAPVSELTRDDVVRMMVGRGLSEFIHKEKAEITTPVLEVEGLTRRGVIENVSFTLRRGEVLGFTGLVGAGRTETARAIFGADRRDGGAIRIEGKTVRIGSPRDAVEAGISLIPEDRSLQGLVLKLSVFDNIVMASLPSYSRAGWMSGADMLRMVKESVERLAIRTPDVAQKAMYLSGGNQQKVVLAKWLATRPKVLIMDEPTRGIDVAAKAEVYALISALTRAGIGIILISSELPEIMGLSDRIVVMHEGRIAIIVERSSATQELIMSYASGQIR